MTIEEIRKNYHTIKAKEEGKTESKLEIAKKLLDLGVEDNKIIEATGLSKEEIENLKKVEKD